MAAYDHIKDMRATLTRVEDLIDVKYPDAMPVDQIDTEMVKLEVHIAGFRRYIETQREIES
jgi:hypothetical protein